MPDQELKLIIFMSIVFFSKFPPQMVSRTGGEVGVLCDLSLPVLKVSLGGGGVGGVS